MNEVGNFFETFKRKVDSISGLLSFRIFAALVLIELIYSASKDFGAGYWEGAMKVMGS